MNFKSDFFKTLGEKKWWRNKFNSQDPRVKQQKEQFDNIAYAIETSSIHNKKILHAKLQKIIDHIDPSRNGPVFSSEIQEMSLDEFCEHHLDARKKLEHFYAENTNYISIISEMKVFNELTKLGLQEIQFLEEIPEKKTPDLQAIENGKDIFVEVKFISPPKKEEQGMMAHIVNLVEENQSWQECVRNKLLYDLTDAKAKFEAMNAYTKDCKRWVYVYIILGSDAKFPKDVPENLISNNLIYELEKKFGIELKFFETF